MYVETSVISYLASRPSRDIVVAGHQRVTQEWWETQRARFHLAASQLVLQKASAGDSEAADARLKVLGDLEILEVSEDALPSPLRSLSQALFPQRQWRTRSTSVYL